MYNATLEKKDYLKTVCWLKHRHESVPDYMETLYASIILYLLP